MTASAQLPPFARRIHQLEADEFAREGQRCDTRRCREPIAVYAWYHRRQRGEVLGHERLLCTSHGEAFTARHHLTVEAAPPASELGLPRPEPRLGAYLIGMAARQLTLHEDLGWHCDRPRCRRPARYLASRRYRTPAGRFGYAAGFLCTPHARRFAVRHGIDFAAVLPPEEVSR